MIPKSGNRFSDKIMLKTNNLDRDPIQLDRGRRQCPARPINQQRKFAPTIAAIILARPASQS
jgi:hypothetical protein